MVWKGWATDEATWEPAVNISDDVLAEYEAGLDAEAELDAEEERELQEWTRGGRRGGRPLSYCSSWEVGGFRDSSMWVCDACVY